MKKVLSALVGLLVCAASYAQLGLAEIFTDNMVLQRDKPVNVWGTAAPGAKVDVSIARNKVRVVAGADGSWRAVLAPMPSDGTPQTLTVRSGREKLTLHNVLLGEVWLASGQSNMEFNMGPLWEKGTWKQMAPAVGENVQQRTLDAVAAADVAGKGSAEPLIRLMRIRKVLDKEKLPTDGWSEVDSVSIKYFSATAYYFAKNVSDSLGVPVGIICSSWGGSPIQDWMPGGNRYECMIAPIAPFTLRGFLWYHGETNLINGETGSYASMQKTLVSGWRRAWEDDSLPFYYVQIAPHLYSRRKNGAAENAYTALAEFWAVQESIMKDDPLTGMVVINDLADDLGDIHPTYKWEVGRRLSLWALNKVYGRDDIVCRSPSVRSAELSGQTVRVVFDCYGSSLATRDGKAPDSFLLWNGKDKWVAAQTRIDGDAVIVSSPSVRKPTELRFAWDEEAQPNLMNAEGLPVGAFSISLP